jgi:uncharacterized damage-inducible protein DinB
LIDTSLELTPEQLETAVPGTYGSILQTMRHLVGADSWFLFDIAGDRDRRVDEERMDLRELRAVMEAGGAAWSRLLATDPKPENLITEVDETDRFERDATMGMRLAWALHHGTDHRSQICRRSHRSASSRPGSTFWNYGVATGSIIEREPR